MQFLGKANRESDDSLLLKRQVVMFLHLQVSLMFFIQEMKTLSGATSVKHNTSNHLLADMSWLPIGETVGKLKIK